jgi:broad specificity phosphatase PhoE
VEFYLNLCLYHIGVLKFFQGMIGSTRISVLSYFNNMNHLKNITHLQNRYFILRHGKSLNNEQGIIISDPTAGIGGYGLVAEGKEQVEKAVGEAVRENMLDKDTVIVSSDFLRAKETAIITKEILGADAVIFTDKLRERFFGAWENTNHSNYKKVWEADVVSASHKQNGVESVEKVLDRTTRLVTDLEKQYQQKNILLIAHGDTLQILQTAFERTQAGHHHELKLLKNGELIPLSLKQNVARA